MAAVEDALKGAAVGAVAAPVCKEAEERECKVVAAAGRACRAEACQVVERRACKAAEHRAGKAASKVRRGLAPVGERAFKAAGLPFIPPQEMREFIAPQEMREFIAPRRALPPGQAQIVELSERIVGRTCAAGQRPEPPARMVARVPAPTRGLALRPAQ